jgi:hypothetical protein
MFLVIIQVSKTAEGVYVFILKAGWKLNVLIFEAALYIEERLHILELDQLFLALRIYDAIW